MCSALSFLPLIFTPNGPYFPTAVRRKIHAAAARAGLSQRHHDFGRVDAKQMNGSERNSSLSVEFQQAAEAGSRVGHGPIPLGFGLREYKQT